MDFDEIDPQLARFINATDTTKGLDMFLKIGGDLSGSKFSKPHIPKFCLTENVTFISLIFVLKFSVTKI